jgi:hypothetical protein
LNSGNQLLSPAHRGIPLPPLWAALVLLPLLPPPPQEVELEGSFKPLHADDGDSLAPFNALAALPNLRSLALGGKWRRAPMPISAAALAASASAKQLTYLALAGLTDADMELLTPALASPEVLDTKANKPWW